MPQVDPTRRAADAPAREARVLSPVGEERPHQAGRRGPAPGAAAGNHSPTMGREPRVGSRHGRASAPPELAGGQGVPLRPSGLAGGASAPPELAGGQGVPLRPSGPRPAVWARTRGRRPAVKVPADHWPTSQGLAG